MKRHDDKEEYVDRGARGQRERCEHGEDRGAKLQEQQDAPPVEYRWQWDGVRGVERSEFSYAEDERQVDTKRDDSCTRTEITAQDHKRDCHGHNQHTELDELELTQAATAQRERDQALPGRSTAQPHPSGAAVGGTFLGLAALSLDSGQIGSH